MAEPEIIGAPQSIFVRTVRMACVEKGVGYTLTPARPHSPEVNAIHPFGRIPVFRHDALVLYESRAICAYVDLGFPGPPLAPRDAIGAAHCEQWISVINSVIVPLLTTQYLHAYFFSGLPDGAIDRARIDAALPKMRDIFALLERNLSGRGFLAGDGFTLADTYLLPLLDYMRQLPESGEMLAASPHLAAWQDRVAARPCATETRTAADTRPPLSLSNRASETAPG